MHNEYIEMCMSKLLTVEDLRIINQPIPTRILVHLAENNGFVARRSAGGTSHVRLTHTKYPDIVLGFAHGTRKKYDQRDLHKAILEIQERDAAAKQAITDKFQQTADKQAATRLANIQKHLPKHIEAFYGEGEQIIVRDTQSPQIGFTLYSAEEDHLLENKIRHQLELDKRELYILLSRSRMEYDIVAPSDKNSEFLGHLSHNIYDMDEVTLPPYPEAEVSETRAAIERYQGHVKDIDLDHAIRKEELLNKDFIHSDIMVTSMARRGERHNYMSITSSADTPLSVTFETYSNQRFKGDGSVARISEPALTKLEGVIAEIERKIAATANEQERKFVAA